MFRRVGQGLRHDEIRRDLDWRGKPRVRRDVQLDRNRRTASERSQSRAETTLGEDRGVDPTRDLLQVFNRVGQSDRYAGQLGSEVAAVGRGIGLRGAYRQ